MKKRVAVLISGNGSNLQALIDACRTPDFPAAITLVISNKVDAYGLERARAAGIATTIISHKDYADRSAYDHALHAELIRGEIELVCLAGFMRLLTPDFTALWQGKMINIHPSLLPAFAGLHTHKRALEAGVQFAGCTVHFVTAEMDAGPIIIQACVPVMPEDNEDHLSQRVLAQEHQIYPKALKWLAEGSLHLQENNRALAAAASYQAEAQQQPQ